MCFHLVGDKTIQEVKIGLECFLYNLLIFNFYLIVSKCKTQTNKIICFKIIFSLCILKYYLTHMVYNEVSVINWYTAVQFLQQSLKRNKYTLFLAAYLTTPQKSREPMYNLIFLSIFLPLFENLQLVYMYI